MGPSFAVCAAWIASAAPIGGRDDYPTEYCVSRSHDWNGDGIPELLLGLNGYVAGPDSLTIRDAGKVVVLSGKDGAVLRTLRGERVGDLFGKAILPAQDWNEDGVPDLWVGAPGTRAPSASEDVPDTQAGCIRLCSGKDGSTLRTLSWTEPCNDAGGELLPLGDLDGDGMEDLCVGSELRKLVFAVSTKTGGLLWQIPTDPAVSGNRLARIPDQDDDGVIDIVVGLRSTDIVEGFYTGRVVLVSGRTGRELRVFRGSEVLPETWAFTGVLSASRDEFGAVRIITQCRDRRTMIHAGIFLLDIGSGTTRGPLEFVESDGRRIDDSDQAASLGTSLAGLPDLDGDGVEDFGVSAPHWTRTRQFPPHGALFVVSGKTLASQVIRSSVKQEWCSCFADEIGPAGDLDGDGVSEIFCVTWRCEDCSEAWKNTLTVHSSTTLRRLWHVDIGTLR